MMYVRTDVRPVLQKNAFARFDDFVRPDRGEVIQSHGIREVARLELTDETGPRTVYLKRYGPMDLKDALKDLLLFRRVRTKAAHEFEMLAAFRRAGIAVPVALAWGERHVLGRDRASFLMLEALPPGEPMRAVMLRLKEPSRRRRLIASAAEFVRRMHQAGCAHTDLFAQHLFVTEREDGRWSVTVIDLQRAVCRPSLAAKERGRDLASLMVSVAPDAATRRERMEFLHGYLGRRKLARDDVTFVRSTVLPTARKLSRRTGYKVWRPILERHDA